MFELSDYLTGIYKITDYTRSLTIRNRQDNEEPNVQMVPDPQNPDYQPSTQSIFEELRRQNVDDSQMLDSQCPETTIIELTGSQVQNIEVDLPEIVDPTNQSPNVSILVDEQS